MNTENLARHGKQCLKALIASAAISIMMLAGAQALQTEQAHAASINTSQTQTQPTTQTTLAGVPLTAELGSLDAVSASACDRISCAIESARALEEAMAAAQADTLIEFAEQFTGTPYRYGGTTPSGFDCSGFVQYCMRNALGIELPRTAGAQSSLGERVPFSELERGDLVFWGSGRGVYHVGIYVGDGQYIHSPRTGRTVCTESFAYNPPSFAKRIL